MVTLPKKLELLAIFGTAGSSLGGGAYFCVWSLCSPSLACCLSGSKMVLILGTLRGKSQEVLIFGVVLSLGPVLILGGRLKHTRKDTDCSMTLEQKKEKFTHFELLIRIKIICSGVIVQSHRVAH